MMSFKACKRVNKRWVLTCIKSLVKCYKNGLKINLINNLKENLINNLIKLIVKLSFNINILTQLKYLILTSWLDSNTRF